MPGQISGWRVECVYFCGGLREACHCVHRSKLDRGFFRNAAWQWSEGPLSGVAESTSETANDRLSCVGSVHEVVVWLEGLLS